jgi:hypothetical protein
LTAVRMKAGFLSAGLLSAPKSDARHPYVTNFLRSRRHFLPSVQTHGRRSGARHPCAPIRIPLQSLARDKIRRPGNLQSKLPGIRAADPAPSLFIADCSWLNPSCLSRRSLHCQG